MHDHCKVLEDLNEKEFNQSALRVNNFAEKLNMDVTRALQLVNEFKACQNNPLSCLKSELKKGAKLNKTLIPILE